MAIYWSIFFTKTHFSASFNCCHPFTCFTGGIWWLYESRNRHSIVRHCGNYCLCRCRCLCRPPPVNCPSVEIVFGLIAAFISSFARLFLLWEQGQSLLMDWLNWKSSTSSSSSSGLNWVEIRGQCSLLVHSSCHRDWISDWLTDWVTVIPTRSI